MAELGIGVSVLRKEDDRFLRGRGQYAADFRMPGMQEVAFVRSTVAHARLLSINIPPHVRDAVFTAEELVGVKPIVSAPPLKGFKYSVQPVLTTGKVRYVGEMIAVCVAPTPAGGGWQSHRGRQQRHAEKGCARLVPAAAEPAGQRRYRRGRSDGRLPRAERDSGTLTYATHAAVVIVDPATGVIELKDYVVLEDGGVLVNPMIVEGQICGGTAQGIGRCLYEAMPFDINGQPLAFTMLDYMLPGATEVPYIRVLHMETPSPYTEFGIKGLGEGGAVGPPAAIVSAVNDALRSLGIEVCDLPLTPERLLNAIEGASKDSAAGASL
jgi:CO/xanthine dehydrogenase Mo-binding subunit